MIDVAIPGDDRVKEKELKKLVKYQSKVWRMRNVIVVPVVIVLEPYRSTLKST